MNMYFLMYEFISGGAMCEVPPKRTNDDNTTTMTVVTINEPILVRGRVTNRKMRASVSVVVVRCGCGTEPTAVVRRWRSMVVVAMGDGIFAAAVVDGDDTMVAMAMTSSIDGGDAK
jgi:hypothetical protein